MARLICNGQDVAQLEIADTAQTRTKGLLGRTELDGALLITKCRSVHTIGMKITIDVAYCDKSYKVIAVTTMKPGRLGLPRWRAGSVIEAEAAAFERWNLKAGSQLEVRQ